jgi:hypothetical protein
VTAPYEPAEAGGARDAIAGFLAAVALTAGAISLVYRPVRVGVFAIVVALVAAGMGGRHARLAGFAAFAVTACWVVGMIIAILTRNPIF